MYRTLFAFSLLHGMALCLLAHTQEAKPPVPDKPKLETLTKQLKDLFKAEYAKRNIDSRIEFAKKLLSDAAGTSNTDQRLVMLTEARDLAAQAGDVDTAFDAVG